MKIFINFEDVEEVSGDEERMTEKDGFNENLYRSVDRLELSVRSKTA